MLDRTDPSYRAWPRCSEGNQARRDLGGYPQRVSLGRNHSRKLRRRLRRSPAPSRRRSPGRGLDITPQSCTSFGSNHPRGRLSLSTGSFTRFIDSRSFASSSCTTALTSTALSFALPFPPL